MLGVCLLACIVPTRRALSVEPKFFVKTSPTEMALEKDEKGAEIGAIVKSGTRPEMKLKKVKQSGA